MPVSVGDVSSRDVGRALRVLLIEDNPEDEFAVRRYLSKAPRSRYQVTTVASREDALAGLEQPFDVCLMDFDLGSFTAIELLKRKRTSQLAGPVILLTGHSHFAVDEAALNLGVADFISKSDATAELLDRTIRYARRQFDDQKRLSFLAHHDPLTGLLNRHAFLERLCELIEETGSSLQELYLFYIDLDGFKSINDRWGHDIGDQALRHTAGGIKTALGDAGLVARYGGDEMVAAIRVRSEPEARLIAERLLATLREPMRRTDLNIVVTGSVGVVLASHCAGNPEQMLRLADAAMYAAKCCGRDAYRFHDPEDSDAVATSVGVDFDLRCALENEELHMVFQPQFRLEDKQLTGVEVLARWSHPQRGETSPTEFIPVAERSGLIRQLTTWSLEKSLEAINAWKHLFPADFRLAVNISPAQMLEPGFEQRVLSLLAEYEVPAQLLRLEITENLFLDENAASRLQYLKDAGISLALDDFGTGYSSLAQLVRLPIDTLKADVGFIQELLVDRRAASLARTIVRVGQALDMTVIAEGVEQQAQADRLAEFGCTQAQGFLYGQPKTYSEFSEFLEQLKS